MQDSVAIGKNIKRLREYKKIYQETLAEKLHVTQKAVSAWENGKACPRMGAMEDMAKIFGCSLHEIIDEEDNKAWIEKRSKWAGTPVTANVDYITKFEDTEVIIETSKPNYENERVLRIYNSLMPDQQERVIEYMVRMLTGKE